MPKVSLVIPAYNAEKYLRECLDSVRTQTLNDWECVVVDDGSKDATATIVKEYSQLDKRFRIVQQQNAGAYMARMKGVDEARGEWVAFMDSDDTIDDVYLERLYALADDSTDIVVSNPTSRPLGVDVIPNDVYRQKTYICYPISPAMFGKLYRHDLFIDLPVVPKEFRFSEDWMMNVSLSLKTDKPVRVSQEYHYRYRLNSDSVTQNFVFTPDYFVRVRQYQLSHLPGHMCEYLKPYDLMGRISALEPHCGYKAHVEADWWDSELRRGITRDLKKYGRDIPWVHRQLLTYRSPWIRRPLILMRKIYNKLHFSRKGLL